MVVRPIMLIALVACAGRTQQFGIAQPSLDELDEESVLAQDISEDPELREPRWATRIGEPHPVDQFFETDALVFIGGSAVVAATAHYAAGPNDEPYFFPDDEGGANRRGVQIPNWQVALGATLVPALLATPETNARWYHTKGVVQSLMTTAAITELTKVVIGRLRPVANREMPREDDRKSFFSGHSSLTLASTTYTGLYLHKHVFSRWRGDSRFAWWELPAYAGLAAFSAWVPYTRIEDRMHHGSDVITGAIVGATTSALFFWWQEHRYKRKADRRESVR